MKKTPCPVSEKMLLLEFWPLGRKIVAVVGHKTLRIHCLKKIPKYIIPGRECYFGLYSWNNSSLHGFLIIFMGSILHKYMIFRIPTSQSNQ